MNLNFKFLGVLLLSSTFLNAQNAEKQTIKLTEKQIARIVTRIIASRDKYVTENIRDNRTLNLSPEKWPGQDDPAHLELEMYKQKAERLSRALENSSADDSRTQELASLRKETELLKMLMEHYADKGQKPVVITPGNGGGNHLKENKQRGQYDMILEKKIDSLRTLVYHKNLSGAEGQAEDHASGMNEIKEKINALKQSLNHSEDKPSAYETLKSRFGTFKKAIFFYHGSKTVKQKYLEDLDNIIDTLDAYGQIDILIVGFASNKGNPEYNQNLSMQRTEAIKRILVTNGVHPTRVLTSYHGIDYSGIPDAKARRAEVTFLIRKN